MTVVALLSRTRWEPPAPQYIGDFMPARDTLYRVFAHRKLPPLYTVVIRDKDARIVGRAEVAIGDALTVHIHAQPWLVRASAPNPIHLRTEWTRINHLVESSI